MNYIFKIPFGLISLIQQSFHFGLILFESFKE
jgi:hypothetical protein